ncbi:hypothetical protein D1007_48062 [Hordeum vulgare]|nr:hypothetical protein D1007_48062 [Hordeum vulgare]
MVYTNDPLRVENFILTMQHLLDDDKYKVVDFNLEYTDGRARHDQKIDVVQLFVNNHDYIFGTADTTNDEKVLKTMGLACRNLLDIQCQYKILGDEETHKDSLVDLAMAIIDLYYRGMKDLCNKKKTAWHRAWVQRMDEDHVKHASKDA